MAFNTGRFSCKFTRQKAVALLSRECGQIEHGLKIAYLLYLPCYDAMDKDMDARASYCTVDQNHADQRDLGKHRAIAKASPAGCAGKSMREMCERMSKLSAIWHVR